MAFEQNYFLVDETKLSEPILRTLKEYGDAVDSVFVNPLNVNFSELNQLQKQIMDSLSEIAEKVETLNEIESEKIQSEIRSLREKDLNLYRSIKATLGKILIHYEEVTKLFELLKKLAGERKLSKLIDIFAEAAKHKWAVIQISHIIEE